MQNLHSYTGYDMDWEKMVQVFGICMEPYCEFFAGEMFAAARGLAAQGSLTTGVHVLSLNRDFSEPRKRRNPWRPLPTGWVLIHHGPDGDCDCMDVAPYDERTKECVIRYWNAHHSGPKDGLEWKTIQEYLEYHLGHFTKHDLPEKKERIRKLKDD